MAIDRSARLDLSRPRAYGELLSTSLQIFFGHANVLLTLAIILVTPATLVVDGMWGGALADGLDAKPSPASQAVSGLLSLLVILPLMTAASAQLVQGLGRGEAPRDVGTALRAAGAVFPRVAVAQTFYVLAVFAGFVLLIVPGIWLVIRCYFATQAAALDGLGPTAAMRRSGELVKGSWWRTCGCLVMTGLLLVLTGSIAIGILGSTGSGALYVAGRVIAEAIAVGVTTVFAALLFYDLRAREGRRRAAGEPA